MSALLFVAHAQQENLYSFYPYQMQLINAAHTGVEGSMLGVNFRSQWSGFEGAPETQSVFFGTQFGKELNAGISIINDKNLVEKGTSIMLDFSYHLQIQKDMHLYMGLKGGFHQFRANLEGLKTSGVGFDPLQQNVEGKYRPNFGLGVLWKYKSWQASLAVPRILQNSKLVQEADGVSLGNSNLHYYLSGAYEMMLYKSISFRPSIMLRYINGFPISAEITSIFGVHKKIELGVKYRYDAAFGGMFVFKTDWMKMGYSYEAASDSGLNKVSNGTHEVLLHLLF